MYKSFKYLTMVVILAFAMVSCSKSDDDDYSKSEEIYQKQLDELRTNIIGTWSHEGNCRYFMDGDDGPTTIIDEVKYTVIESEKDTLVFESDYRVLWLREPKAVHNTSLPRIMEGNYSFSGGPSRNGGIAPGIVTDFHINNYPSPDFKYVVFSQDKKFVFLPHEGFMKRYRRQ